MSQVTALRQLFDPARRREQDQALNRIAGDGAEFGARLDDAGVVMAGLHAELVRLEESHRLALGAWHEDIGARAALAAIGHARVGTDGLRLEGASRRRHRIRRHTVHAPLDVEFARWMASSAVAEVRPDIRRLWDGLLAAEARASEGHLRCGPCTVLDVGPGRVEHRGSQGVVATALDQVGTPSAPVVALPRCAYDWAHRKLRNFGHWLLDALPPILALDAVAPEAVFLLPEPVLGFHRRTLQLFGIPETRLRPWGGEPVDAARLLLLESDGRAGGGRPYASILAMRERAARAYPAGPRHRRLYISRRDAPRKRRWVSNEPDVEACFASRGFEVLTMSECSLPDQVQLFAEARIVAGVSGAGLADVVFAAPGTDLLVIHTEGLVQWYADETGARSGWAVGERAARGALASLGDSPRFYAHLAAALGLPCHAFLGPDVVPIDVLAPFLDGVLARMETAA